MYVIFGEYICPVRAYLLTDWYAKFSMVLHNFVANRVRQLYKNISMLFLFPVKDGELSTGVNATFNASCYG